MSIVERVMETAVALIILGGAGLGALCSFGALAHFLDWPEREAKRKIWALKNRKEN